MGDDRTYYAKRRDEELDLSRSEPSSELRKLHQRWAELYEKRLKHTPPDQVSD